MNMDFNIRHYNKYGLKQGKPSDLKYYLRFYDMKFDNELDPKGKYYGNFYTLTQDGHGENIVNHKEYKGYYSRQTDYVNYKLSMAQDRTSSSQKS
jgi:hypothetical protein